MRSPLGYPLEDSQLLVQHIWEHCRGWVGVNDNSRPLEKSESSVCTLYTWALKTLL